MHWLETFQRATDQFQEEVAAARALLIEMMADVDEDVGELFLMEEEVWCCFSYCG